MYDANVMWQELLSKRCLTRTVWPRYDNATRGCG
jgi:hypothetical protein